jgi:hypothetical protein
MLHLHKRDRYARRPDKFWRSKWLREVTRSFTLFDIESRFWYNNITPTNEETKDNDNDTQSRPS